MRSDARIAEMQRRIQRWLGSGPGGQEKQADGTVEGLDADLQELESKMRALFPGRESTKDVFEALRDQSMFRTVLESVVEGVVVADMDGQPLVFNPAAQKLLGRAPGEGDSDNWSAEYGFFYLDGQTPCPTERLPLSRAIQGEPVDGEELIVRTPGRDADVYIHATARPLFDAEGDQMGGVVVFHDVTESWIVEQEQQRARKAAEVASQAKSEFLANMSHEIRTPLTAVLGFADLLMDGQLGESERLNYIQAVRRNGEHLLALINDVLDISKIQASKMHVESLSCSLHQLVHETASIMQVRAHEKGLLFEVEYETPIPVHIRSDAMRVRQVLLNLLSNAIKFTRQGRVKLTARCVGQGTEESRVELAVSDTGIGLSDEDLEQLFQPFQQASRSTTREYGGTGLGLAISRSLAEALGGEIRADSRPGEGSTFTFVLFHPIDETTEMVSEHGLASEELQLEAPAMPEHMLAGRVLLAEDGLDNQLLISTILQRQGLEVEIAENGEIAVNEGMRALESSVPYDLILMDMQMPKLDGYGATAKLRSRGYTGPIVALTAHAMTGERERCIRAGCDDYLTKPIARTVLIAAVASHLSRVRGGLSEPTVSGPELTDSPLPDGPGTGDHPQPVGEALYSSYADDPDMDELISGFVERLPQQVADLRLAADERELEKLKRLAHQLKGAAGGYGFMPVSEQAAAVETFAREDRLTDETKEAVARLESICERVRHGPTAEGRSRE
ncbi:PAS fold-containing protein [Marinobacter daqiaonensis]|uniref:histidine kinase n=1 Tax=Marinobacter daqiaonensis TaxID=650891 RepID=A0A1I6JTB0_9GAMM|nr:ATP-binding protein [Marinobacter daqiaonensis]SFR82148.1 PAS fold-containing protein [Marinobacter daqiaonensis]